MSAAALLGCQGLVFSTSHFTGRCATSLGVPTGSTAGCHVAQCGRLSPLPGASLRRVEPAVHGLVRGGLPRAAASSPAHAGRRCLQQSRSPSPLFGHSLSSRLGGSASSSFSTGVQSAQGQSPVFGSRDRARGASGVAGATPGGVGGGAAASGGGGGDSSSIGEAPGTAPVSSTGGAPGVEQNGASMAAAASEALGAAEEEMELATSGTLPTGMGAGTAAGVANGKAGEEAATGGGSKRWQTRWTIVLLCFFAFLLCNMDRVNMSIAILPMSEQYKWSPTTVGLVQSSFFWGYLLTQVAGGIWADSIGGKQVLGFGVVWWSIATILTPVAAKLGLPALLFARACMGVGEGVAMPAMNNLLSQWVPVAERSRSLALVYSGMYLGSVTGLAFSPSLIHRYGWPSVFYSFGSLGTLWFVAWQRKAFSRPSECPDLDPAERALIAADASASAERPTSIPWRLLLSKAPVWAIIISHFCHNWGTFILLTWMPTYYHDVLGFNLTESGLFSVLPWLTMAVSANVGGWIADTLISRGVSITTVRKVMQTIGFLGPALCLSLLSKITTPALAVVCMMVSQGCDAFSQSGLYSNHQDIGPRYSGVLLGISNTAGVLAGVLGTAVTGFILQNGTWDDVFKVAVGLYLVGTVVWNTMSTGEKILD